MKRKFYYAFGLIFIILTSAHGQDDSVFDRINGINLKDNIYLRWNETKKTFEYSSDNIDSWHIVDDNIIFKTRNYLKAMQIFGISNGFQIIDFEKREPIEQSRILLQKFL